MFGKQIAWVPASVNVLKLNSPGGVCFLKPQTLSAQMSDLADPSPLDYAQGGTGVRVDSRRELHAQILGAGLDPE